MIVSNASLVPRHIHWGTGVRDGDTKIGQFIVQNDEGEPVTRTAWQPAIQHWLGGSEWDDLEPGDAVAFDGDIIKN